MGKRFFDLVHDVKGRFSPALFFDFLKRRKKHAGPALTSRHPRSSFKTGSVKAPERTAAERVLKKVIISTTINTPTEAIRKYDAMKDWTLVVAGDLKTPKDYRLERGIYISPEEQEKYHPELSEAIGWNDHGRRNFACLWAKDLEADIIAVIDDDNIPLEGWGEDLLAGRQVEVDFYETGLEAFDPLGATNYPHLWHRGFPVQLVSKRSYLNKTRKVIRADIQADLWNGDPDVDAICRMAHSPDCLFEPSVFPLASSKPAPFNTQNIFITRDVLPYFFILPGLTPHGRVGDIWTAYHVQALGFQVLFNRPSVYHARHVHNLTTDMIDEYLSYEKSIEVVRSIQDKSYDPVRFWPARTLQGYKLYQQCFAQAAVSAGSAL